MKDMAGAENIYLIGYRCTGKTTVGRLVAQKLGMTFVDGDELLVAESHMTVAAIVESEGWPGFRAREKALVQRICQSSGQVVAPGGGAVLDPDNADLFCRTGMVVWLTASVATISRRMNKDAMTTDQRPSLTGKDVTDEIRCVLEQRNPVYRACAHHTVDTDFLDINDVCDAICEFWRDSATDLK